MPLHKGKCDSCRNIRLVNLTTAKGTWEGCHLCSQCWERLEIMNDRPSKKSSSATRDDISPWQENAIRELEGE